MNSMDGNCRVILALVSDNVTNVGTHNCQATAGNCKSNTNSTRYNKVNDTDNYSNNNRSNGGSENDKVRWYDKEAVLMHRGYHVVCMLPLLEFLDEHKYKKIKAMLEQTCRPKQNRCEYQDNKMEANSVTENNTTNNSGSSSNSSKITPLLTKLENEILSIDEVVSRIRSFCIKFNIHMIEISVETILQHVEKYNNKENSQASSLTQTIEHQYTAIQTSTATTREIVTNSDNCLQDAAQESQLSEKHQLEVPEHTENNNVRTQNRSVICATNNLHKSKRVTKVLEANVDDKQTLCSSLFIIVPCHPSQLSMIVECLLDVNCFTHLTESNKSENSECGVSACNENNNENNNDSKEQSRINDECNEKQQHDYPLLVVFDMTKQSIRSSHSLGSDKSNNENSVCKEEYEDDDDESEEDCWAWLRPTPSYLSEFCQVMNETNVSFSKRKHAIDKGHRSNNSLEKRNNEMSYKAESKTATTDKEQDENIYQLLLFQHNLRTKKNKYLEELLQEQGHHTSSSSTQSSSSKVCKKTQEERITNVADWCMESNERNDIAVCDLDYIKWCAIPVSMYSSYPIIRDTGCVFANMNSYDISEECTPHQHCNSNCCESVGCDFNQCTLEAILRECAYKVGAMAKYGS